MHRQNLDETLQQFNGEIAMPRLAYPTVPEDVVEDKASETFNEGVCDWELQQHLKLQSLNKVQVCEELEIHAIHCGLLTLLDVDGLPKASAALGTFDLAIAGPTSSPGFNLCDIQLYSWITGFCIRFTDLIRSG